MGNYPMVDQVNKLIGNILAERGEVALPEIGTLCVERIPSERLSRSTVKPPCRRVTCISEIRGKRLAAYIADAARCEAAAAEEIYGRWLARVYTDGVLTIEGIGVMKERQFVMAAEFERRLNPQGTDPVRIRRGAGADWVLWCGVAAIGCGLFFGAYYLYDNHAEIPEATTAAEQVAEVGHTAAEPLRGESAAADSVCVVAKADSVAVTTAEAPEPAPATDGDGVLLQGTGTVDAPAERVSQRSYVVLGVFGSRENAARALNTARKNHPDWSLGVYRLGDKLLVSAFESDKNEPCQLFKRAHRGEYEDMWVHKAR